MIPHPLTIHFAYGWLILLLASISLSGCASVSVVTIPNSCTTPDNDPSAQCVVTNKFWGIVKPKDVTPPCAALADKNFNHLNGVKVWTTTDQVLLSLVTLGIVVKHHIRWCCAPYIPPPAQP